MCNNKNPSSTKYFLSKIINVYIQFIKNKNNLYVFVNSHGLNFFFVYV